jgi:autotransporter-associated beta strand protein
MKQPNFLYLAILAGLLLAGNRASAAPTVDTWTGATDANWNNTSADWSPNGTFTNDDSAVFTGTAPTSITIASGIEIGNITSSNKGALDITGGNYTFGGSTLTFDGTDGDTGIEVSSGASATFNVAISETGASFYAAGQGSNGTLTFADGLQSGGLNTNALGSYGGNQLYIGQYDGATVDFTGGNVYAAYTNVSASATNVSGTAVINLQQLQLQGNITVNGASASVNVLGDNNRDSLIVGTGNNPAELDLKAGTVTASGGISIDNQDNNTANQANTGTLLVEGGTLTTDTGGSTPQGITIAPTQTTGGRGNGVLTITGGTVTTAGITFGGSYSSGTYDPTATSSATANISGGTTYIGALGINQAAVAPMTNTINLSGGTIGATANWSSSMAMNLTKGTSGNVTFQTSNASNAAGNITLSGVLSGTGGLNVVGPGVLTLAGNNTYSGTTDVLNGATLSLTSNLALASTSTLTLDTFNSSVDLTFSGYDYIAALNINGTAYADGIYNASQLDGSGSGLIDVGDVAVPEPNTWALLIGGIGALVVIARRRAKAFAL